MDIATYFESDDFLDIISPLGKYCGGSTNKVVEMMNFFISVGIDYWRLFNDSEIFIETFNKFMKNVVLTYEGIMLKHGSTFGYYSELKDRVFSLYLNDLLDKFNLNSEDLTHPVVDGVLREFIAKKILNTEYKFHAFNGVFLDSIREHGLDPSCKFETQEELDMISALFEKHGEKLILGWQKLNCEGKVSYANGASNSYYYAVSSPEWFAQFTGQGFSFNPEEKYCKSAFTIRNHEEASNNLMTLMQEKHFSSEEIEIVTVFFNKYWEMYANANSRPMLCMIPSKNDNFDRFYDSVINGDYCKKSFRNLFSICFHDREHDGRTSDVISADNALFVTLPEMSRVMEKMNIDNKNITVRK